MPLVDRFNLRKIFVQADEPTNEWVDGDVWVDSDTGILSVNVSGTATTVGGLTFARVVKSADETIQSDTVLSDDSELFFTPTINKSYSVMTFGFFNTGATPSSKWAWSIPNLATMIRNSTVWNTIPNNTADDEATIERAGSDTDDRYFCTFSKLVMGGTAGNATIQWAQNVSDAGDTTVLSGSTIIIWED